MFWFAGDLRRMGDLLALRMDGSSPLPEGELGSERIGVREENEVRPAEAPETLLLKIRE